MTGAQVSHVHGRLRARAIDIVDANGRVTKIDCDALAVSGNRVAFVTPEGAQGASSLDGDADADDRVAQVYDAATASLRNLGQAAEELVLGDAASTVCGPRHLVAIRSAETGGPVRLAEVDKPS